MQTRTKIITAFSLCLPMLAFYCSYLFFHDANIHPTGFIQPDNVSYVAYAKQYLDTESFHLQYSNPFNDSAHAPIYFQPQTLLFAFLMKTGIPPGWILIPFTLICAFICFWLIISIYDFLVPEKKFRTFNIWLFAWGGGLLVLGGAIAYFFLERKTSFLNGLFVLDPENGWWGLNFGRSLFFSCEAYYHALFLGCIYCLLKKKWLPGFISLLLFSLSHPFTGIELIGIVCLWGFVEMLFNRKDIPYWFIAACLLAFCFHIYYYLFYLEQFPDHSSVSQQYTLNWGLRYYRMIPAYALVGLLAIMSIYQARVKNFFQNRSNRLFLCWFVVAFLLANHELFIEARQPIHFTRGYIWTSLFLLGLPFLLKWNHSLKNRFGKIGLAILAVIFFLDNFTWIADQLFIKETKPSSRYITMEQRALMRKLNEESDERTLIISNDRGPYLSTVYTPAYPWLSHAYTTPFVEQKKKIFQAFMDRGQIDSSWLGRKIVFIFRKDSALKIIGELPGRVFINRKSETGSYSVFSTDSLYLLQ